ncbi:MAG: pyruvate dehydrogenase (acetyl-transferring) E1 component subunit alpha [Armatimonadetes bacterium]|nr:pyruvate dehydrogenase (acetyl-transferring) E1 component subunit alpha [Armatimonadota bacterium]MDE2207261.1 pyruvate dehydrogenase (acetyl-transferring) E1 component subunit alpha [Armatimonadota bacterium]
MGTVAVKQAKPHVECNSALEMLRMMVLIREFEAPCDQQYRAGKIGGYVHYYNGQEAVATGLVPLLRNGDTMITAYRDHGYALALGTSPQSIMAELFGKATGCAGGKGGSMHLYDVARGFLGGYGIVGGSVPLAVGSAFALKYRNMPNLCITFLGDGAMEQGAVHEAMNMAGLYHVPCLFVLENNGYAMGTSVSRHAAETDFVKRVTNGYAIEGERVDGMDVLAVRAAGERVMERMREDGRPFFLEAVTYRYAGHGFADNAQQQKFYRTDEEIDAYRHRDPIDQLYHLMEKHGDITEADFKRMQAEAKAVVEEAIRFAEESPFPSPDSLFENVLSGN